MSANPYLWPKNSKLSFYNGRGKCLFTSTNRRLDLSDTLMLDWQKRTRTIYLGICVNNINNKNWSSKDIHSIENLIHYDITFDGYKLTSKFISKIGAASSTHELMWKLVIKS